MIDTRSETEATPATYPNAPAGLSAAAAAIAPALVWTRLESWINRRYPVRSVTWVVATDDGDEFVPRLTPATLTLAEQWTDAWEVFTPDAGPQGLCLPPGTFRLTYNVGEATPPTTVLEAYRRLVEFWVDTATEPGLASVTDGDYSATFSPTALAKSLQLSGAADLLRGFRQ